MEELNLLIGGPQGAGLETSAQIIALTLARMGYRIISDREYHSNIKGRHSYVHSRISARNVHLSLTYPVDILGCMDAETLFTHYRDVRGGGIVIYDSSGENVKLEQVKSMDIHVREKIERF